MEITVDVIADTSGSMEEMGKRHISKGLLRYVNQLRQLTPTTTDNIQYRFFTWSDTLDRFYFDESGFFSVSTTNGNSNLEALSSHVNNANSNYCWIVLSDGCFSSTQINTFISNVDSDLRDRLFTVAIGADAEIYKLTKLSSKGQCFLPENIATAVSLALHSFNKSSSPIPEYNSDVSLSSDIGSDIGSEDDWDA